ncbi:nucleotidyltransferase family protein, partial [Uliginosibacterium sediminicola]
MDVLRAARTLELAQWCIGAGVIRNLVWDSLHGKTQPSHLADVDLAYFDASDLSSERDARLQAQLTALRPDIPWEVTNQAGVHRWFEQYFGHPVEPLRSLTESVASWPEYATAVAVWLDHDEHLHVIAPHGLDDLLQMRIRRNPTRVSLETYRQRVAEKNYPARWPNVSVET